MYFWMFSDWYDERPVRDRVTQDGSAAPTDGSLTVDQRLTQAVTRALFDSPAVTGGVVDLCVQNGVAILRGTIESDDARAAAVAAAVSVPGVRDICDALVVDHAAPWRS